MLISLSMISKFEAQAVCTKELPLQSPKYFRLCCLPPFVKKFKLNECDIRILVLLSLIETHVHKQVQLRLILGRTHSKNQLITERKRVKLTDRIDKKY